MTSSISGSSSACAVVQPIVESQHKVTTCTATPFRMESMVTPYPIVATILHYLDGDELATEDSVEQDITALFYQTMKRFLFVLTGTATHSIPLQVTTQLSNSQLQELGLKDAMSPAYPDSFFDHEYLDSQESTCALRRYPLSLLDARLHIYLHKHPTLEALNLPVTHYRLLMEFQIKNPGVPIQIVDNVLARLGKGTYGEVFELNETQAVKVSVHCRLMQSDFLRRAEALGRMTQHPHINRFEGIVYIKKTKEWGFVFQKIIGKTLKDTIATLSPEQGKQIAIDILEGAHHFHLHGVCHQDFHDDNVMVSDADQRAIFIDYEIEIARGYDTIYAKACFFPQFRPTLIQLIPYRKFTTILKKVHELTFEEYSWAQTAADIRSLEVAQASSHK